MSIWRRIQWESYGIKVNLMNFRAFRHCYDRKSRSKALRARDDHLISTIYTTERQQDDRD